MVSDMRLQRGLTTAAVSVRDSRSAGSGTYQADERLKRFPFLHLRRAISGKSNREQISGKG